MYLEIKYRMIIQEHHKNLL